MSWTRRRFSTAVTASGIMASLPLSACEAQDISARSNLYQCEGCDGVFERKYATLRSTSTMATSAELGERLIAKGRVFAIDGITPVAGVVIYAYQTNHEGLYANGSSETEWSRRHGRLRGWLKTDGAGAYLFKTIKPAPYPNNTMPAHIHFTILEEGKPPYWIDDIVFDGEFGVTDAYRQGMVNQGGDGISTISKTETGEWLVTRDILLERHP